MNYAILAGVADIIMMAGQQFVQGWFTAKFIKTKRIGLYCALIIILFASAYFLKQFVFPARASIISISTVFASFALAVLFKNGSTIRSVLFLVIYNVCLMGLDYVAVLTYNTLLPRYSSGLLYASFSGTITFSSLDFGFLCLLRVTGFAQVAISLFVAYLTLREKPNANSASTYKRINRFIPIFVLEMVFVGFLMVYTARVSINYPNIMWLMVVFLAAFYALDILVWRILQSVENEEKLSREKFELQLYADANAMAYKQIMESDIRFRSLRHDMLNQLQTAVILLERGETNEVAKQLLSYRDKIDHSKGTSTGNHIVDAILLIKEQTCSDKGIKLRSQGILPPKTPLDDSEMCSVVGNILDNAINGTLKRNKEDGNWDYIDFAIGIHDEKLVISCKNPSDKLLREDVLPPHPDQEHGWGLYILDRIAQGHGGAFTFIVENGEASALFWTPYAVSEE